MYSGTLDKGTTVLNCTKGTKERLGRILQMHANHREDIDTVYAGDIAAAVGVKNTTTGDTFCDEEHPIILESMVFPEACYPGRHRAQDQGRSGEDGHCSGQAGRGRPTFKTYTDERPVRPSSPVCCELTWRLVVDRLLREFKVEPTWKLPRSHTKRGPSAKAVDQETRSMPVSPAVLGPVQCIQTSMW